MPAILHLLALPRLAKFVETPGVWKRNSISLVCGTLIYVIPTPRADTAQVKTRILPGQIYMILYDDCHYGVLRRGVKYN